MKKKWIFGTIYTRFSVQNKDLVKIIEACGKNGVLRFKKGDVDIVFNGFVIQNETDYAEVVPQIKENREAVDPKFVEQHRYEEQSEEMEHLLVTDPAAYEEELFKDNLEDSETHMDDE